MKEKDYSDWLIVSDIDETLNNKFRRTPKVNTEAIDRFVHTIGGNFTLASARNVQSLRKHYMNLLDVRTPAIVLNGAGIYDFSEEKMIWFNSIPLTGKEIIEKAMEKFPALEIGVFTDDMIYLVRARVLSRCMMALDSLRHIKCRDIDEVPEDKWGKVIFYCLPHQKKEIKKYVQGISGDDLAYIDTTVFSFDMVSSTTHKGNALLALAEILRIPVENTGAIGDYYNDLDMLKTVSHPACCKQAPEEIHSVCEFHACHCNKGAVADFLKYIENNY